MKLKIRVHRELMRSVPSDRYETWSLRAENVFRLDVLDHSCLQSIARIGQNDRMRELNVRQCCIWWICICRTMLRFLFLPQTERSQWRAPDASTRNEKNVQITPLGHICSKLANSKRAIFMPEDTPNIRPLGEIRIPK